MLPTGAHIYTYKHRHTVDTYIHIHIHEHTPTHTHTHTPIAYHTVIQSRELEPDYPGTASPWLLIRP